MAAMAMLAAAMTSADALMLVVIVVLLAALIFLSVAEMGLSRLSRHKAASMADSGSKAGKVLVRLVAEPERWVNPLLLLVNICQTVQATLTGIVAGRLFGPAGVAVGVVLNVVVFFVLAEAVPKTYAVIYPERAARFTALPVSVLVNFGPLRWVSRGLHERAVKALGHVGITDVITLMGHDTSVAMTLAFYDVPDGATGMAP